jgi:hypothetical protein
MNVLELVRLENTPEGAVGILKLNKHIFCATLEPPERANQQKMSCIPASQYYLEGVNSPGFGRTYTVLNVPGRTLILFHAGNRVGNTEGCILLGETIGKLSGNRAVLNSGVTFKRFMEALGMEGNRASLTIYEHY